MRKSLNVLHSLPNELKNCPSCGSEQILHLDHALDKRPVTGKSYVAFISGCLNCGLVFINPPPTAKQIDAYYQPDGTWVKRKKKSSKKVVNPTAPGEILGVNGNTVTYSMIMTAEKIRSGRETAHVLDFGCGDGHILDLLQDRGWDTTGIDPATAPVITRHTMISAIPQEPTYDLIVLKHVIEHLADPLALFKEAHRCLKPGGYMLVGTPTLDKLWEHQRKWYCINREFHLTAYTSRSITNLLALANFSVDHFLESIRADRMALLARKQDHADLVSDPLRDAQLAFHKHIVIEQGWIKSLLPVRVRARLANSPPPKRTKTSEPSAPPSAP